MGVQQGGRSAGLCPIACTWPGSLLLHLAHVIFEIVVNALKKGWKHVFQVRGRQKHLGEMLGHSDQPSTT